MSYFRNSSHSGSWYSSSQQELNSQLTLWLSDAAANTHNLESEINLNNANSYTGNERLVRALIAPHAGF